MRTDSGHRWTSAGGTDLAVPQRPCGIEQPLERITQVRGRAVARGGKISFDVVDRTRQHVELVVQSVQFGPGNDQFVVAQLEFGGSLPGDPVPLPTTLGTELARASRSGASRDRPATPSTVRSPDIVDRR